MLIDHPSSLDYKIPLSYFFLAQRFIHYDPIVRLRLFYILCIRQFDFNGMLTCKPSN